MNKNHKSITFSFETEKDNSFSFLDFKICREKDIFTTSVFRKDTFTGVYNNFSSFVALKHNFGSEYTLLHRSFTIVSDFSKFHFELRIVLPYLGNISSITKKLLNRCISKRLKFKLKIIFQTANRLKNVFRFKDRVLETFQSNFNYKFKCGSCTAPYYGKTDRHMKVRVSEHQGVSPRTGKRVKGMVSTSVRDHMLECDHTVAWEDFSIKPLPIANKRKPFY